MLKKAHNYFFLTLDMNVLIFVWDTFFAEERNKSIIINFHTKTPLIVKSGRFWVGFGLGFGLGTKNFAKYL